ncbi:hypothetical protein GCM10022247_54470 [Allokutzneria multivorans]|uniref:Uncharacterized protein n=1 Tax=Allokutzneria multivorans TaxID=1142134 RepID=A0ABP7TA07_9PSEU
MPVSTAIAKVQNGPSTVSSTLGHSLPWNRNPRAVTSLFMIKVFRAARARGQPARTWFRTPGSTPAVQSGANAAT